MDKENKYYVHETTHLDIPQRWIVMHSKPAESRSEKTLNKQIEKEYRSVESALLHLRNKEFGCEHDAKKELTVAQKHLREQRVEKNETLPNQINNPIKNLTVQWIYQLMEGVDVVYIRVKNVIQEKIIGMTELRQKIISFLFDSVHKIYENAEMG